MITTRQTPASLRKQLGTDDKVVSTIKAADASAQLYARLGFCSVHLKVLSSSVGKIVRSYEKRGFRVWTENTVTDVDGTYTHVSVEW
jgi:hypothetical protein